MIKAAKGSIFTSPANVLINPVNTVGVMGKGLAAEFKKRYPAHFSNYQRACRDGRLRPGRILVCSPEHGRTIICLSTKRHWREPSRLAYIKTAVAALSEEITRRQIESVAIPALGCGLGQLSWKEVRPVIQEGLAEAAETTDIYLYAPGAERGINAAPRPRSTRRLMDRAIGDMKRGRP